MEMWTMRQPYKQRECNISCDKTCAESQGNPWEKPHFQTMKIHWACPGEVGEQEEHTGETEL